MPSFFALFCALLLLAWATAQAGIRDRTRPESSRDTAVSLAQGRVLSLSVAEVRVQSLQHWVRLAGEVDERGRLQSRSCATDAVKVLVGQRVLAFAVQNKASVTQARVSRVEGQQGCVTIESTLDGGEHVPATWYVVEVLVPLGRFLAVPNEAVIETESGALLYQQHHKGHYRPVQIQRGMRGERYTEVLEGLRRGDQVVTLGSFFIHAQHRLESVTKGRPHVHHAH